jgi:hypothetical protein
MADEEVRAVLLAFNQFAPINASLFLFQSSLTREGYSAVERNGSYKVPYTLQPTRAILPRWKNCSRLVNYGLAISIVLRECVFGACS